MYVCLWDSPWGHGGAKVMCVWQIRPIIVANVYGAPDRLHVTWLCSRTASHAPVNTSVPGRPPQCALATPPPPPTTHTHTHTSIHNHQPHETKSTDCGNHACVCVSVWGGVCDDRCWCCRGAAAGPDMEADEAGDCRTLYRYLVQLGHLRWVSEL